MGYLPIVSKPILDVELESVDGRALKVQALFDTGSFYTILREACLPPGTPTLPFARPRIMGTAARGGQLTVTGATRFEIRIGEKIIEDDVLLSPDLGREMLIGSGTMQKWDITVRNESGRTDVVVGRDRRDPEITEVD